MAVSRTISETFSVKYLRDLEIWVNLRPVYSDATQLNSTQLDVELSCVAINGLLEVTQCHSKWYHSKARYTISCSHFIATMALSCIVSEIKRDLGRKSRFFYVPPVHSTSQLGGPHQTIAIPFGILKLYHRSGDRRRECKVLFFWTLVLWRRFSFVSLLCNFV